MPMNEYKKEEYLYIPRISSPDDVKSIPREELPALAEELRRFLIEKVTANGGHLASNLGVVELTLALHRVFASPTDRIIWDVGHQAYVHKILTGRAEGFSLLRRPGGLSGFPTPRESEHDPFGTGHSSTSVSAALGFAEADALSGEKRYTVAVVGDGAFTGGMVHEALNNCHDGLRLIIVLNDNEMSISRNIGLFAKHLSRIRASRSYGKTKRGTKRFLRKIPLLGRALERVLSTCKNLVKRLLLQRNYFEELGLSYLGPIDGHNERALERALTEAKARETAVLVHVCTVKGKGYEQAEEDPTAYHGISPKAKKKEKGKKAQRAFSSGNVAPTSSFHSVAADTLLSMAAEDEKICAVTAAMGEGTGMVCFAEAYPERYFDVGIAEEHAVTFSAGLAAAGYKPYFAVYSTFLQRAYDNLLHDVALQGLPVRFLVDRASLASADGPTHHGIFDIAFASHVPGIRILAPATYGSLKAMLRDSAQADAPLIIRYPNAAEREEIAASFYPHGEYEKYGIRFWHEEGAEALIVTYGPTVSVALAAAQRLEKQGTRVGVCLIELLSPYTFAADKLIARAKEQRALLFLEEGIRAGGAGIMLRDAIEREAPAFFRDRAYDILSVDGHFAAPDKLCDLAEFCGIDAETAATRVKQMLHHRKWGEKNEEM